MTSIDLTTLFTILFVIVDDWYLEKGCQFLAGRVGRKPRFSNSETMTLMLAAEFIPFPSENQYLSYIRANYSDLFPDLLSQSQFNRRARGLRHLVERMRLDWLLGTGLGQANVYLLDTKPVPVLGYKRSKKHSDFLGSADYGYCASRHLRYFGYKLVMISTVDGIPLCYELTAANTDERQAAETVLDYIKNVVVIADKGFLGADWQARIQEETGNKILTPRRKNQKIQHGPDYERQLNRLRERIEGVFHELQNTGRNLERLLAKTVDGLATRLITKITAHLFKRILRVTYQIDIQNFQGSTDFT